MRAVTIDATPTAVSVADQYPELQHLSDNLVAALQALGAGLIAVSVALIGLSAWTSFGNEHRHAATKAAAVSLVVGLAILAYAPLLATVLRRIFSL